MTAIGDDKGYDLGPVPIVSPDLLALGYGVMRSHFKTPDSEVIMPEDLEDVLDDIMAALGLDGETTVAVFRRVCASLNYLADRQELRGLAPPARPFEDPIFCAAAARCSVVHEAHDEELASDTFDPAVFEPTWKRRL